MTTTVSLPWLTRLRWGAVLGQLALILVFNVLDFKVDSTALIVIAAITGASNLWLSALSRKDAPVSGAVVGSVLLLDVFLLTAFLSLTGGPSNPFTVLYLVHITLAAVMLGQRWTWGMATISILSFGLLFLADLNPMNHHDPHALAFHLHGMWVAFSLASILIAFFLNRILVALRSRDEEVTRMRLTAAENKKFASLVNLSAGAAHELGSPLGTIAIVSKEMEHSIRRLADAKELLEDAKLIRAEVGRCRDILDSMAGRALDEEETVWFDVEPVLEELCARFERTQAGALRILNPAGIQQLRGRPKAFQQALHTVVKNAFEASVAGGVVVLKLAVEGNLVSLQVEDRGVGMSEETRIMAGEPFFTTKGPGKGMGLGLFLVRLFTQRDGGDLNIESQPGVGTTISILLPWEADFSRTTKNASVG